MPLVVSHYADRTDWQMFTHGVPAGFLVAARNVFGGTLFFALLTYAQARSEIGPEEPGAEADDRDGSGARLTPPTPGGSGSAARR